jgi:regulator of protease activity HflC (stomatin/prohibitin superfamily)
MKLIGGIIFAVFAFILVSCITWCGSRNDFVPQGHEGYRINKPFMMGEAEFINTMVGPKSTGWTWRDFVSTVDMRPETYTEKYEILSSDNLNVSFNSHIRISLKAGTVREVVEKYSAEKWYVRNVKEQSRCIVRETVAPYKAYEIKAHRSKIATDILAKLKADYKNTPIVFETVSIGNIDYPNNVNKAIEAKLAAQQLLEKKAIELEMERKQAEIRIVESKGIAEAQRIINKTLTTNYLQHEAIQTYGKLAGSPNTTFVLMPTNPNGAGMPLILNSGK